jgi:HEPN domain-containing protein
MSASADEVKVLKSKAREFLSGAQSAFRSRDYDLACFLYEQGAQLALKAELLSRFGEFPRTHSLRSLLAEFRQEIPGLDGFLKQNRARISLLEDAYFMARYSGKRYLKDDADDASKVAREIVKLIHAKKAKI